MLKALAMICLVILFAAGFLIAWSYHEADVIQMTYRRSFGFGAIWKGALFLGREVAPTEGYPSEPFELHGYRGNPSEKIEEQYAELRWHILGIQFYYGPVFGRSRSCLWLPAWLVLSGYGSAVVLGAEMFRRRVRKKRRQVQGKCVACGYELTNNISGICPECGTAVRAFSNSHTWETMCDTQTGRDTR